MRTGETDETTPRQRVLDAALRLLEREGPGALQARRLAAETGASTMAVYTHFGGMPQLLRAMTQEGLARFAAQTRAVRETDDPMADLIAGGLAYGRFATTNPQLYKLLFGLSDLPAMSGSPWDLVEGADALSVLVESVTRVVEAGRIRPQEPVDAAVQILSATHGFVLLLIGGFVDGARFTETMLPLAVNLMVGLGDTRHRAEKSLERALAASASAS